MMPTTILISGGGTTLENLIEQVREQALPISIDLVISSRPNVRGLQIAIDAGIATQVIRRRDYASPEAFGDANFSAIRDAGSQLVVMGGYLQHLLIPQDFEKKVLNIHPSLIPAFAGQGYYGLRVHQAAIDAAVPISGCTVHYVDNQYDHGPIVLQRECEVLASDTAETLQQRVFQLERQALPDAIRQHVS
jgi:phosphoribosylglycinamide formyltransferase-1